MQAIAGLLHGLFHQRKTAQGTSEEVPALAAGLGNLRCFPPPAANNARTSSLALYVDYASSGLSIPCILDHAPNTSPLEQSCSLPERSDVRAGTNQHDLISITTVLNPSQHGAPILEKDAHGLGSV